MNFIQSVCSSDCPEFTHQDKVYGVLTHRLEWNRTHTLTNIYKWAWWGSRRRYISCLQESFRAKYNKCIVLLYCVHICISVWLCACHWSLVRILICVTCQNKPDYMLRGSFNSDDSQPWLKSLLFTVYQQSTLRQNDMSPIMWFCAVIGASWWQVCRWLFQSTVELFFARSSVLSNQENKIPVPSDVVTFSLHLTDSKIAPHLSSSKVQ